MTRYCWFCELDKIFVTTDCDVFLVATLMCSTFLSIAFNVVTILTCSVRCSSDGVPALEQNKTSKQNFNKDRKV